jgi:hypothetical protein
VLLPALPATGTAQLPDLLPSDWPSGDPVLPRGTDLYGSTNSPAFRPHRLRLFRMTPGFLSDPVGLDQDDPTPPGTIPPVVDPGPEWVTVAMGNDNPFFDFRRPGDPGGVGYYRVHTQVQLFETTSTGCAVGLQAVTPAGLEMAGINDGPTVLTPAFSLFHYLDDGTGLHCFLGKHVNFNMPLGSRLRHAWQYGVAVQRPLSSTQSEGFTNVYWFVEALGRYRYDPGAAADPSRANIWEVLPGVQWKVSENWWISGGVILPVSSSSPTDTRLWQITCAFQF